MISKLKPKSEFTYNVLTLMTGTTIAQAIPIAISPILTRIYTPEDFGLLALFVAIISIFGSIANGRYELAIMLPKKDEDAINIMALGFIITVTLSIVLLFSVLFFQHHIIQLLNNQDIAPWLYLIPFSVFLIGCFNLLHYFNNRKKFYKDLAKATIYKSIGRAVIQLSFGFLQLGVLGLISGQIFSQIISNTKLFFNIKRLNLFAKISKVKIIMLGKKYKDFPKFSIWAILANTLAQNLINILISSFYNIKTLGFYSLAQRLLGIPSSLIGSSIGQVFFQEATKEEQKTGNVLKTFNSTVKKLLFIAIPSFGILFFIIEDIFSFVFGEEWKVAGKYAQIIVPLFFVRFISNAVSSIYDIYHSLKLELIWQITVFTGIIIILYLNKYHEFKILLIYISIYSIIMYFISFYLMFNLVNNPKSLELEDEQ
jgi:O-antigen/teichoic acid export membrane protein